MKHHINHHIHSTGSDGKLSPEQVVRLAIEKGLNFICFTDHYPRPRETDLWGKDFHSKEYYERLQELIKEYANKIEISFGAEFDWFEDHKEYTKNEINQRRYDFIFGSVHKLPKNKEYLNINNSEDGFKELLEKFSEIKILIKEYYKQIRLLASSGLFDCIAHLDLIKIFNENSKYFNENETWYIEEILDTLEVIRKNNLPIEINTSGLKRNCKEQYPSFWILKEAQKRNIPITISSDCHYPEEIDYGIDDAIELAKKAGYTSILKFKKRKPIKIEI